MIKRGELSAPISVFLNVTNHCNLRCRHCMVSSGEPLDGELSTDEWLAVIRRLVELKIFRARVTGGEPFMRPDIFQLLEALERGRMAIELNTNATLVDKDVARRLAGFNLLKAVNVSLDGSCAAVHDSLRGPGAFDRAVRGVEALVAQNLRVKIGAVVTQLNLHDLEPMIHLARRLGVRSIGFGSLHPAGRAAGKEDGIRLSGESRRDVARRLMELEVAHSGFVSSIFSSWYRLLTAPPPVAASPRPIHPCGAALEACAICADGAVLACNAAPDYVCGNIREDDLLDIWRHSPQMQAVRALSGLTVEEVEGCRTCAYRHECTTGCRADAWSMTGDWSGGPGSICWQNEVRA